MGCSRPKPLAMTTHNAPLHPSTGELLARHLEYCRARNMRPSTIYQRRRMLIRLARFIAPRGLLEVDDVEMTAWLDSRQVLVESRACEISHLRSFYKWCVVHAQLLEREPSARLIRPRVMRRLPRPISDEHLALALAEADEVVLPMLLLAAYAGLRACEISQLRRDQALLHQSPPLLVLEVSKGGGMSSVPLHPVLVEVFDRAPSRGHLFARRDGIPGPLKPWSISRICNDFLHSLGISHTLHCLRHWYGTNLHRAAHGDLRVTQEGMRHLSPVSTAIYTFVAPDEVAAAVLRLPAPAVLTEQTVVDRAA